MNHLARCSNVRLILAAALVACVALPVRASDEDKKNNDDKKSQGGACWELAVDTSCADSHYKMNVMRDKIAPQGTQQSIKCLSCASPKTSGCNYQVNQIQ